MSNIQCCIQFWHCSIFVSSIFVECTSQIVQQFTIFGLYLSESSRHKVTVARLNFHICSDFPFNFEIFLQMLASLGKLCGPDPQFHFEYLVLYFLSNGGCDVKNVYSLWNLFGNVMCKELNLRYQDTFMRSSLSNLHHKYHMKYLIRIAF